jgi:hypothetical protein
VRRCDAYALVVALAKLDIAITPAAIRQWAVRGKITRVGRDQRGRTLYDIDEVIAHARRSCEPSH